MIDDKEWTTTIENLKPDTLYTFYTVKEKGKEPVSWVEEVKEPWWRRLMRRWWG